MDSTRLGNPFFAISLHPFRSFISFETVLRAHISPWFRDPVGWVGRDGWQVPGFFFAGQGPSAKPSPQRHRRALFDDLEAKDGMYFWQQYGVIPHPAQYACLPGGLAGLWQASHIAAVASLERDATG